MTALARLAACVALAGFAACASARPPGANPGPAVIWLCGVVRDGGGSHPLKVGFDDQLFMKFERPSEIDLHPCTARELAHAN